MVDQRRTYLNALSALCLRCALAGTVCQNTLADDICIGREGVHAGVGHGQERITGSHGHIGDDRTGRSGAGLYCIFVMV